VSRDTEGNDEERRKHSMQQQRTREEVTGGASSPPLPGAPAPKPMAGTESHDRVLDLVRALPAGSHVLDVPCGHGALSVRLRDAGYDVTCCDIDPGIFEAGGLKVDFGNLNETLPYGDSSFDAVTHVNGIHRIFNTDGAVREMTRVLKPGGRLIISLPNYSSIRYRWRFLRFGSLATRVDTPRFEQRSEASEAHFRQILFYPKIKHFLERHGLSVEAVTCERLHRSHWKLLPLAWVARIARLFASRHEREHYDHPEMSSRDVLLGGRYLIIDARKPPFGGRSSSDPAGGPIPSRNA
jgi:ubiquinone/menaquinone biosynthesis C-methylase UbiE